MTDNKHTALVAFKMDGTPVIMDYRSTFLDWMLDGLSMSEVEREFIGECKQPNMQTGLWLLTFKVGGSEDEYWLEREQWRRPSDNECSDAVNGTLTL